MNCRNCNNPLNEWERVCPRCGTEVGAQSETNDKAKSLVAFILGLIAGIFGIMGGICTTMCSSLFSSGVAPFLLILGGSIMGLVGACQCLKNAKLGGILQLSAAGAIIICAYGISGADFMSIIAMLLFIAGGVTGVLTAELAKKK